jgi:hypothetical protein
MAKKESARLRRDGSLVSRKDWQEVLFVSHEPNQPARRPTLFVKALVRRGDRKWFEEVLKRLEGLEVPD